MINSKLLRSKVLDLAMRGQLSKRIASDSSSDGLYKEIIELKQELVKNKVIRKDSALDDVQEGDYDIPTEWKWVRFGKIITLQSGQDLKSAEYNNQCSGIPYITGASNFNDDGTLIINRWTEMPKNIAKYGDVLVSVKGTVGKISILSEKEVHIARQIMAIRTYKMDIDFVKYFVESSIDKIKDASKGMIPGIERNDILNLCCPLPPIEEQKRIAEKLSQAFRVLDNIDNLKELYLSDLEILKSKIIDAGIQGKLTEQFLEDGNAEELYAAIQEEKTKLIKAKKIKKQKKLPDITLDETPFDIPDNWKWVRFNDIANIVGTGMIRSGQEQYDVADYYYFKMNNIENFTGKCDFEDMTMVNASDDEFKKYKIEEGDFLFNTRNSAELVGKTAVVHNLPSDKILLNNNILKVLFWGNISPDYINYYFISRSGRRQLEQFITSTTNVAAIYQRQIVTLAIPLPPLAEQKRIVKKVNDYLSLI